MKLQITFPQDRGNIFAEEELKDSLKYDIFYLKGRWLACQEKRFYLALKN